MFLVDVNVSVLASLEANVQEFYIEGTLEVHSCLALDSLAREIEGFVQEEHDVVLFDGTLFFLRRARCGFQTGFVGL